MKKIENYFEKVRKVAEKEIDLHNKSGCTIKKPHSHLINGYERKTH